jgi:fatty-acyl-CoA synthase
LAIIDGFKDVDYIQTVYELIPELKTQERGKLKTEKFPFLQSVIYVGPKNIGECYNTNELMLLGNTEMRKIPRDKASVDNNEVVNMQYTPLEPLDSPKV